MKQMHQIISLYAADVAFPNTFVVSLTALAMSNLEWLISCMSIPTPDQYQP
jgi:hypothetical protein